jgi:hypothetical protein
MAEEKPPDFELCIGQLSGEEVKVGCFNSWVVGNVMDHIEAKLGIHTSIHELYVEGGDEPLDPTVEALSLVGLFLSLDGHDGKYRLEHVDSEKRPSKISKIREREAEARAKLGAAMQISKIREKEEETRAKLGAAMHSYHESKSGKLMLSYMHSHRLTLDNKFTWGHKLAIKPTSKFRLWWDVLQAFVLFYLAISVPVCVGFDVVSYGVWYGIDLAVDVYFWIDIGLNFFFAFDDGVGKTVYDLGRIRQNYLRSWFPIDLVASIPVDLIERRQRGTILCSLEASCVGRDTEAEDTKNTALLRMVKLLRLFFVAFSGVSQRGEFKSVIDVFLGESPCQKPFIKKSKVVFPPRFFVFIAFLGASLRAACLHGKFSITTKQFLGNTTGPLINSLRTPLPTPWQTSTPPFVSTYHHAPGTTRTPRARARTRTHAHARRHSVMLSI